MHETGAARDAADLRGLGEDDLEACQCAIGSAGDNLGVAMLPGLKKPV